MRAGPAARESDTHSVDDQPELPDLSAELQALEEMVDSLDARD